MLASFGMLYLKLPLTAEVYIPFFVYKDASRRGVVNSRSPKVIGFIYK